MAEEKTFSRRGFFKVMGLSATAATLASCQRRPLQNIIPFLKQPEDFRAGEAVWYASTCGACSASCGLLVKTRDGRPIKIEGNDLHPVSKGGVCAIGQASILSLYDAARSPKPVSLGKPTSWTDMDRTMRGGLRRLGEAGRAIRLVTPPYAGPSGEAAIARFLSAYPTARRVSHDPFGTTAIARAHLNTHGVGAIPAYRLDAARVVVGFGADFLGTWLQPVALTKQYVSGRNPDRAEKMSRHIQFEPNLTLTGSNADVRTAILPSDLTPALMQLAKRLGVDVPAAAPAGLAPDSLDRLAADLRSAQGESLVLCGSDDIVAQCLTNAINEALGNYGTTISLSAGTIIPESDSVDQLLAELRKGEIAGIVFVGTNPVYSHPEGAELAERLPKVEISAATNDRPDETGGLVQHLAPDHHYLESWGDSEAEQGVLGLYQPAVAPIFDTRSAFESILTWAGEGRPYYDFIRRRWESDVFPVAVNAPAAFDAFWDRSVRDGLARYTPRVQEATFQAEALTRVLAESPAAKTTGDLELVLYPSMALRDGALGNNAWLQELPDPITKITWGNVVSVGQETAGKLGVRDGDVVKLRRGDRFLTLPVLVQPGMRSNVAAVGLGYGRKHAGSIGDGVGENGFLLARNDGRLTLSNLTATIERTGQSTTLARSQTHDSMENRELVREIHLEQLLTGDAPEPADHAALHSRWLRHEYPERRWAMSIDLSKCTGCSACVVACRAENNITIVGPDEVRRHRDMDWIRIDRYYEGEGDDVRVLRQPMLCQHCENAPCESVCPVLATVHSSDGLNQQVYNRCVGTRYCANNCPFKVRRFNWFDYPRDPMERMVLNPDVVVRSRGVMEKCSFCFQRIRDAKTRARLENRPIRDGDLRTACQQSCPADAIVVGDLNDSKSRIAESVRSKRNYHLLTELNIDPAVSYLARVRNPGRKS